ncbi:MAG: phosphoribosylglycinamide formyltransferase [Acidobacteriota bacterium]|jgi:folate-dependent phosphoribosylglycinamide formyltransferase PurN
MPGLKRVAIFFSGHGGGAENLIKSSKHQNSYIIALLVCSNPDAPGVSRLASYNIPIRVVPWGKSKEPQNLSMECFGICDELQIDVVCLAGWLKQLVLPEHWLGKVLNIHPSLLPLFGGKGMYGLKVHEAVIQSRSQKSGCTVHLIDNELDRGRILGQSNVEIDDHDTPESLQQKVYKLELELYPEILKNFLSS